MKSKLLSLLLLGLGLGGTAMGADEPVDTATASRFARLALDCVHREYPNKIAHVLNSAADAGTPSQLHPVFYGCFDWHSSVHGHWSLVRLLKMFPDLEDAERIREMLSQNISRKNIANEVAYFEGELNKTYERTYGWAWLLKMNPLYWVIEGFRWALLGTDTQPGPMILVSTVAAVTLLVTGASSPMP